MFSTISNLQTHYHFKLDFQKEDQYTGGGWLIHGTKHIKHLTSLSRDLKVEEIWGGLFKSRGKQIHVMRVSVMAAKINDNACN